MRSRLASHRFRRRALWAGAAAAVVVGIVVPTVLLGNTAKPEPEHFSNAPVRVFHEPKIARLTGAERAQLLDTSLRFVRTAVAREHLDQAYALAGPELLQGMSKREWMTGKIPVVPFPAAGVAQWAVAYSYANDVAFQLSLVAKPGSSSTIGKTFTIELVRHGAGPWRVASWTPVGISSSRNDLQIAAEEQAVDSQPVKAPLARWWLALPALVLGLVLLIPVGLGIRSWLAGRRSARELRSPGS